MTPPQCRLTSMPSPSPTKPHGRANARRCCCIDRVRMSTIVRILSLALCAFCLVGEWTVAAGNSQVPLIPRTALFGNPVRAQARLSPDGRYLSFLAPKAGVLNVWVAREGKLDAAIAITDDK